MKVFKKQCPTDTLQNYVAVKLQARIEKALADQKKEGILVCIDGIVEPPKLAEGAKFHWPDVFKYLEEVKFSLSRIKWIPKDGVTLTLLSTVSDEAGYCESWYMVEAENAAFAVMQSIDCGYDSNIVVYDLEQIPHYVATEIVDKKEKEIVQAA